MTWKDRVRDPRNQGRTGHPRLPSDSRPVESMAREGVRMNDTEPPEVSSIDGGDDLMANALAVTAERYQRTPPTEEALELIRAARGGDLAAFEMLVQRHERRVLRVAYQMVGNLDDAQDVAQEVFIRLWKYLGKMRDEAKFSTWLYRLVVNSSYDLLNRRKVDHDHVSFDDPAGTLPELADESIIPLDRSVAAIDLKERVV